MRTYDDHLAAVREAAGHRGTVTLPLLEAVQSRARTATDTVAQFDSPRFHNSQMDGYALPDTAGGRSPWARRLPQEPMPPRCTRAG